MRRRFALHRARPAAAEVERGLLFAYLYENKIRKAKKQVAHCLELAPADPVFTQFQEALKGGKVQRIDNRN